jgi:hypothetical protein
MDGLFENVGGFFEDVIGAARDVFVARQETAQAAAQNNAAVNAAAAQSAFDLDKLRIIVLAVVGGGVLIYLATRR